MNASGIRTRGPMVAGAVCVAAVAALLLGGLSRNIIYFRTVSEGVATRAKAGHSRLRLAGAVVPGSVRRTARGVDFSLTDGVATVAVEHQGDPPELFKDGAPIVVEGHWSSTLFLSDQLMIKHGSEYSPPKVSTVGVHTYSPGMGP